MWCELVTIHAVKKKDPHTIFPFGTGGLSVSPVRREEYVRILSSWRGRNRKAVTLSVALSSVPAPPTSATQLSIWLKARGALLVELPCRLSVGLGGLMQRDY